MTRKCKNVTRVAYLTPQLEGPAITEALAASLN
jgi:hypothetical protein